MNTNEDAYVHACAYYPGFTVLPWELASFPGAEEGEGMVENDTIL